jgi:hypothetical protein
MPFMSYQVSPEQALASAGRIIKEGGADCVKLEGGVHVAPSVQKITRAGIPVVGHIGLTPQSSSALGGFKVQGKTREEAEQLIADARALDEAGIFAIVLECIPSGVAKVITESIRATTIGVGAGPHVDGHNLNAYDLLGLFGDFVPRFARQYKKMAAECTEVFNSFTRAARSGHYPTKEEAYSGGPEIEQLFPLPDPLRAPLAPLEGAENRSMSRAIAPQGGTIDRPQVIPRAPAQFLVHQGIDRATHRSLFYSMASAVRTWRSPSWPCQLFNELMPGHVHCNPSASDQDLGSRRRAGRPWIFPASPSATGSPQGIRG